MSDKTFEVTLTVYRAHNRVLFAESDAAFVDVLFTFLTLPMATVLKLAGVDSSTPPPFEGCIANLYKSANGGDFVRPTEKDRLLHPRFAADRAISDGVIGDVNDKAWKFYACDCGGESMSSYANVKCSWCSKEMSRVVTVARHGAAAPNEDMVFLKPEARFLIGDNFVVSPASTDTAVSLIEKSITADEELESIEEMKLAIGRTHILDLLKQSLISTTPFTDLFLEKPTLTSGGAAIITLAPPMQLPAGGNTATIAVKLYVDKVDKSLLYAEGSQEFVELLLSFLTLPLGLIVKNSGGVSGISAIDNLYNSAVNLDTGDYFLSELAKEMLVNPKLPKALTGDKQLIKSSEFVSGDRYYMCRTEDCDSAEVSLVPNVECKCGRITNKRMKIVDDYDGGRSNYAKFGSHTVTDALAVSPVSPLSVLRLRLARGAQGIEEVKVEVGEGEAAALLRAAVSSSSALTDALLAPQKDGDAAERNCY